MQDIERNNLCQTCWNMSSCSSQGIFERQACEHYEPMTLNEVAERDEFTRMVMVGSCPECGSKNTSDCDSPIELIRDPTIGYCFDCGKYWCLECGHVCEQIEKGMEWPHWEICALCAQEHGYLDGGEFIDKICPTCEHYDYGCKLEDPLKCEKQWQYMCPYEPIYWECPKIQELLSKQS